jgi:hypothetical protein
MDTTSRKWRRGSLLLLILLAAQMLLAGCSLCTRRLYLFRDTEAKGLPSSQQALLITDPRLARVLSPASAQNFEAAGQWAPEQPAYSSDVYRLSVDQVDGKPVYQGLCLDTQPSYSVEVHPGPRQVRMRLEMFGPWGQEKVQEVSKINLEPGGVYFLRPESEALGNRQLVLKVVRLPNSYDAGLRTQVQNWNRQHEQGRTIAD